MVMIRNLIDSRCSDLANNIGRKDELVKVIHSVQLYRHH